MNQTEKTIARLRELGDAAHLGKMARFGIPSDRAFGVPVPALRRLARETGRDHALALALWETGFHEARLLAPMVARPEEVSVELADRWTGDFDAWDICDLCCQNLFRKLPFAFELTQRYARRPEEFVRRTAFALMAALAVGDKASDDERFLPLFPLIREASADPRNFVRKAVNWALRQTGKRNLRLHAEALQLSRELAASDDRTAAWIGRDALRELSEAKIIARIRP